MKQNKFSLLFTAAVCGVLACQNAGATTILVDQFSGYATGNLGASGTGGTGGIPGWFGGNSSVTVTNGGHSLDGTGLGLVSSTGDKVTIAATSGLSAYNKFCNASNFPQTVQTNLYYSFLYRFNVGTDVSVSNTIIEVTRQNGNSNGHLKLVGTNVGGGMVQLGISKLVASTATNYATNLIAPGQTIFVVVRQQIIPGANNDIEDLWINPPTNSFGASESNVPPVSATTTNGTEDSSGTGPGRFYVGSGASANLDELRIATSWAEATPPVGQCLVANITVDPTNVTQVAEISATFSSSALGTSPNYQWQISKNGGVTFSNIVGANQPNYTTPNLVLATDNSNRYRMIVTVPCNSTADTSAVATVSLTAPIVTPPGLVMDDFFTTLLRDSLPVTTNNSFWCTTSAATGNLNAVPGTGLVAIPLSNSSSLWLGYFTDIPESNVPPVHLAVGTTMKVTLPFIPASYTSFTNNGSMRFGVYDYADGGTPLTLDSPAAGGSSGNGTSVRGYMLSLDFGQNFSVSSPLSLLVRNGISDINLMGTTGDYQSMGSGPSGGGFSNAPAFQAGTTYTLVLSVSRTDVNSVDLTAAISGGGTNWTFTSTDTNFAYHRFDAFGIRPSSIETTADQFTFPEFKVEVVQNAVAPFDITSISVPSPNTVVLTWASVPNVNYDIQSTPTLSPSAWVTNATVLASGTSTSYTNTPVSGSMKFYRVVSP